MDGAPKLIKMGQGWFVVRMLGLAMTDLYTKFEISTLIHYKYERQQKVQTMGGLMG